MIDKQRARLGDMANGLRGAGGTISISRQDAVRLEVEIDDESEVVEIATKKFVSLVEGLGRSEQDSEEPSKQTEDGGQGSESENNPEEPPKKAPAKKTPTKKSS